MTFMGFEIPFLHLIFVGFVALFPPVNPLGTALIINPMLDQLNSQQRRRAAAKIAFYSFSLCVATLFVGSWLFNLFGISLPIVQIAGGVLICKMGWDLLSKNTPTPSKTQPLSTDSPVGGVENILFYPLAFPMTTGAGSISVLLTLSAHGHSRDVPVYLTNLASLIIAVTLLCAMVYVCYAYTPFLLKRLGPSGEQIVNRLSAFLVFCVGLQIASGGVSHFLHN
ncbi:inner membrane protein [compost metagenome]